MNSEIPQVSVIIPTHSRPDCLQRAVDSARHAGNDVEIIVVDDASRDRTAELCRALPGIRHVRIERNQGVAGARNVGIAASRGDYIAFLDDDDMRLPGSINLLLDALEAKPDAGFAYGPVLTADQHGTLTGDIEPKERPGGDIFWHLLERNCIYPSATLIRKTAMLSVGLLNPQLAGFDEWDLCVRISELFPVIALNTPVAIYRAPTPDSDQLTTAMSTRLAIGMLRHQLALLRLPRAANARLKDREQARRATLDRVSDRLILTAQYAIGKGKHRDARERILAAVRLNPARALRPNTFRLLLATMTSAGAPTPRSSLP